MVPSLRFAEIMRQIGELFLLRTNLNSVGSVLDSPVCPSFICSIQLTDLRFPFLY